MPELWVPDQNDVNVASDAGCVLTSASARLFPVTHLLPRTLLIFPGDDAPILSRSYLDRDSRPVILVVPDGTWGQAARIGKRLPGLEHAEMVRLPEGPRTRWGIRREPHHQGLATFEAIARAFVWHP